jgi:LmbE family N-acetylglucosaminyl deacetylase
MLFIKESWSFGSTNDIASSCVMFVAHPDDEIVFAGSFLLQNRDKKWLIVSVTTPQPSFVGDRRRNAFLERLPSVLGCDSLMLNCIDSGKKNRIQENIEPDISRIISSQRWEMIVTHGRIGEYGHMHHRQVHEIVKNICSDMSLIQKLYVFDPQKKDRASIPDNKKNLFEMTYDCNHDLSDDHNLVKFPFYLYNVYREDGNGGWIERIVPYSMLEENMR